MGIKILIAVSYAHLNNHEQTDGIFCSVGSNLDIIIGVLDLTAMASTQTIKIRGNATITIVPEDGSQLEQAATSVHEMQAPPETPPTMKRPTLSELREEHEAGKLVVDQTRQPLTSAEVTTTMSNIQKKVFKGQRWGADGPWNMLCHEEFLRIMAEPKGKRAPKKEVDISKHPLYMELENALASSLQELEEAKVNNKEKDERIKVLMANASDKDAKISGLKRKIHDLEASDESSSEE